MSLFATPHTLQCDSCRRQLDYSGISKIEILKDALRKGWFITRIGKARIDVCKDCYETGRKENPWYR